MKSWPTAPQAANPRTFLRASGWRDKNEIADDNSVPVDGGMGRGRRARRALLDEICGMRRR